MSNEKIIKDIDEIIMTNRISKQLAVTEMEKDSFRKSNDALARARTIIKNFDNEKTDEYTRGLNDAWNLAQKIGGADQPGFYDADELDAIFGWCSSTNVFDHFSYTEALAKVEEYEKKKAEEAAILVRGDIVKVTAKRNSAYNYGIYLGDDYYSYYILRREIISASQYTKNFYTLEKTGQHVDLEGWSIDD